MNTNSTQSANERPLLAQVKCPHCWNVFPPDQALWIAEHPDLTGDTRLGTDHPQRFLPTRFTVEGAAIDTRGFTCHGLACPKCHLSVPRPMFEMRQVFASIFGAPACGKSYFLTSMTWRLREVLPKRFSIAFNDIDSVLNHRLQDYESQQFLNAAQDELVAIEKTQTHGDLYDTVLFGDQAVNYPCPFVFSLMPLEKHPNFKSAGKMSRILCLYDNAGESFLPGEDTAASPVTRHLALSRVLMFLFDPTQDIRFRRACRGKTSDPQMKERTERLDRERPVRQETILTEAAQRVRRYVGLGHNKRHSRPLIVVITKFDSWSSLLKKKELPSPWISDSRRSLCAMDFNVIEALSQTLRSLLWKVSPEIVSAAESFAKEVIYIPVSATGHHPESDPKTGALGIRPKDIRPIWAEVPLLYTMARWMHGLVPHTKPSGWSKTVPRALHGVLPSGDGNGSTADDSLHETAKKEAS